MLSWLSNPWVAAFVAPVFASTVTAFVKWSTQNDRHAQFRKEDVAVGPELAITAIVALITSMPSMSKAARRIADDLRAEAIANGEDVLGMRSPDHAAMDTAASVLIVVFLLTFGLWITSTVVRKIGWIDSSTLKMWPGFLFPLAFGLVTLFCVSFWIASVIGAAQ